MASVVDESEVFHVRSNPVLVIFDWVTAEVIIRPEGIIKSFVSLGSIWYPSIAGTEKVYWEDIPINEMGPTGIVNPISGWFDLIYILPDCPPDVKS